MYTDIRQSTSDATEIHVYVGYVRIAMSIWYWILASVRTDVSARCCEL